MHDDTATDEGVQCGATAHLGTCKEQTAEITKQQCIGLNGYCVAGGGRDPAIAAADISLPRVSQRPVSVHASGIANRRIRNHDSL